MRSLQMSRSADRAHTTSSAVRDSARIALSGVTHRFGPVTAIKDVDITIADGEFVSVVGPSGCGKSTILHLVAGLLPTQTGAVTVDGRAVAGKVQADKVGLMFARDCLFPWRNALKNVLVARDMRGASRDSREAGPERARELLELVGLGGFEKHYPSQLSQGMRQRVALARTLAHNPDILLLDEPFAAVDAQTKVLLRQRFLSIWEQDRKTVLLITHDIGEAVTMSDRVVVMTARPGRIKAVHEIDVPREGRSDDPFDPSLSVYFRRVWEDLLPEMTDA